MGMAPSPRGEFAAAVHEAIEIILSKCRAAGLICGMLAPDGHSAAELVRRGFQFVTISNDIRAVQATMKGWLAEFSAVADR
jgi:2-keto-3-deoxy-L-rhamnonate aldolase RhmA